MRRGNGRKFFRAEPSARKVVSKGKAATVKAAPILVWMAYAQTGGSRAPKGSRLRDTQFERETKKSGSKTKTFEEVKKG